MEEEKKNRAEKAVMLFRQGFNCAQSVAAVYADRYGFTEEQMLRMAASFGGGIGRMRLTCGAACALFLLAGLETGSSRAGDRAGKEANYALVQKLAAIFKQRNGSITCGELLGLQKGEISLSATPEERTTAYYNKRPCVKIIEDTVEIWEEQLNNEMKQGKSY